MVAKTRLSLDGYGARRAGDFSGKQSSNPGGGGTHPVAKITRLSADGYGARRNGSFAGKTQSGSSGGGAHPVGKITRLSADGYGARRCGSFAGKATGGPPGGGPHPVARITRLSLDGYGARRYGSFAGKTGTENPVSGSFSIFGFRLGGFGLAQRQQTRADEIHGPGFNLFHHYERKKRTEREDVADDIRKVLKAAANVERVAPERIEPSLADLNTQIEIILAKLAKLEQVPALKDSLEQIDAKAAPREYAKSVRETIEDWEADEDDAEVLRMLAEML